MGDWRGLLVGGPLGSPPCHNVMAPSSGQHNAMGIVVDQVEPREGASWSELLLRGARCVRARYDAASAGRVLGWCAVRGSSMKVLTFFNHAGGVAKTSTVRDIGYVLGEMGNRVLLIDLDPQANLTKWLGVDEDVELSETVYPAVISQVDGGERGVESEGFLQLPTPRRVHGMELIPSNLGIAIIEREILSIFLGVLRLREAVRKLEGYDFVLIDPPPSLGQLSALAVVASDRVVVPLPTNRKGLDGIQTVVKMVREYKKAARDLDIAMFVLTQHDRRTRHDRESQEIITAQLPVVAPISSPLGSRPAIYSDAQVEGLPIPLYAPGSEADREVRQVTQELLAALEKKA